jgi:hypothetical protein
MRPFGYPDKPIVDNVIALTSDLLFFELTSLNQMSNKKNGSLGSSLSIIEFLE